MLQIAEKIVSFDIIVLDGFNDKNKPCFNKYRVSKNKLTKVLLDYQNSGIQIVSIYPLEEVEDTKDDTFDEFRVKQQEINREIGEEQVIHEIGEEQVIHDLPGY